MNELTAAQLGDLKQYLTHIAEEGLGPIQAKQAAYLLSLIEQERWVPVSTLPPRRDKGDQVKDCSEWLILFESGDCYRGYYMAGHWLDAHMNDVTPTHWKLLSPPTKEG